MAKSPDFFLIATKTSCDENNQMARRTELDKKESSNIK